MVDSFNTYIYRFYLLPFTNNLKGWSLSDFLVLKYLNMASKAWLRWSCRCHLWGKSFLRMLRCTCFFESQRVGVDFSEVNLGNNLCSDWVVPSTALTASWYTLENCQEVWRELGRKYGRWTRPSGMPKNVYCICMHISYIICHISKYYQIKLYLLNDATSLITVVCITLIFVDISDRVFRVSNAKHFWGKTSAILKGFLKWIAPWQFSQKENTGHQNRCAQISNSPWIISLGRDEKKKTRDSVSKYWFTIHSTPSHRGHYQPKQCIVIREIPHRFLWFDFPQNGQFNDPLSKHIHHIPFLPLIFGNCQTPQNRLDCFERRPGVLWNQLRPGCSKWDQIPTDP